MWNNFLLRRKVHYSEGTLLLQMKVTYIAEQKGKYFFTRQALIQINAWIMCVNTRTRKEGKIMYENLMVIALLLLRDQDFPPSSRKYEIR